MPRMESECLPLLLMLVEREFLEIVKIVNLRAVDTWV